MTTELDPEQAARVAKLAQRRAASSGRPARTPEPAATATMQAAPAPDSAFRPAPSVASQPPAAPANDWAPPQYKPVRYTQPIAITVAKAAAAAEAAVLGASHAIHDVQERHHAHVAEVAAAPAGAPLVDRQTNLTVTKNRRRHAAAAGRVLATGLATSGFFGTITSFAASDQRAEEAKSNPSPDSAVTVRTVERTIYVDEFGNPVAPPSSIEGVVDGVVDTTLVPGETVPGLPVDPNAVTTVAGAPAPAPAPVGGGTPAPTQTTAPKTSGGTPTTAPKTAPAPGTTQAPAPATTQPPAPVTTQPPATTQAPATTAAPTCSKSKCP